MGGGVKSEKKKTSAENPMSTTRFCWPSWQQQRQILIAGCMTRSVAGIVAH